MSFDPQVQGAKIAALERAMQQLVDAQRQNQAQLLQAFHLTDAHLWVLRQLGKDIVAGTVMLLSGPTPAVNMEAYYDLFNAHQQQEFEKAAKAKAEAQGAPKTKGEDQMVFGGDLNDEDSERNEDPEEGQSDGEISDSNGGEEAPVSMREPSPAGVGG